MIRFGLRLAIASGREALTRLVIITAAVAIGVGLLLATVAGINAVNSQNARYAWLNTSASNQAAPTAGVDPLWWNAERDFYDGATIGRIDVAATGPTSPVPPGIEHLPGPDEFYASPAMSALLRSTPADQLAARYPGHQIGELGSAALPSPDSLIIVVGHTPDEMSRLPHADHVTSIANLSPGQCTSCEVGTRKAGLELILSVVALAMLFPVLIFVGAATRLAAARREQRFAAMRLIGATPRQISIVSAVETTLAAAAGTVLGFGLFALMRDPLSGINLTGATFYPSDLSLDLLDVLLVGLGIPIAAAIAARIALRRVQISPLGVTRRVTPKPPRAYRLLPMVLGVAELAFFIGRVPKSSTTQVAVFLPGFFLIMGGLIAAGPWLTMVGSRVLARVSNRPATLIAARRLGDNPTVAFRAISGLVLGLFVTSVATGIITTITDNEGGQRTGLARTLVVRTSPLRSTETKVPDALVTVLRSTPGVRTVTIVRQNPDISPNALPGLVACADLAGSPALGTCPSGAAVAQVWMQFIGPRQFNEPRVWPASTLSAASLQTLPVASLSVNTDGSTSAIERARTQIEAAYPQEEPPATDDDFRSDSTSELVGWQQLANVVILASLPIAGCSLAVSIAGGLTERKRPFSLLRLTGVRLRTLRRVVALESAVPLLVVASIAIAAGLLGADLFLRAQMQYTLRPLRAEYYVVVIVGLLASLGIIASTLPLLERITGPETARND